MYNAITAWGTAYHKTGATSAERSLSYEAIIAELENLEYDGERMKIIVTKSLVQLYYSFVYPSILSSLKKGMIVLWVYCIQISRKKQSAPP